MSLIIQTWVGRIDNNSERDQLKLGWLKLCSRKEKMQLHKMGMVSRLYRTVDSSSAIEEKLGRRLVRTFPSV